MSMKQYIQEAIANSLSDDRIDESKSMATYKEIANLLKKIDTQAKKIAADQKSMKHPTDELGTIKGRLESVSQLFEGYQGDGELSEDRDADYEAAKKRVQKIKKGTKVSFTTPDGESKSGQYNGMSNRGGRSYAKVEMGKDGMTMVPVTQIR